MADDDATGEILHLRDIVTGDTFKVTVRLEVDGEPRWGWLYLVEQLYTWSTVRRGVLVSRTRWEYVASSTMFDAADDAMREARTHLSDTCMITSPSVADDDNDDEED